MSARLTPSAKRLLVVCGEASGDVAAARVLRELAGSGPHAIVAIGGAAVLPRADRMLADLRDFTAMGIGELAPRAGAVVSAYARAARVARKAEVDAALLVGFSEFNGRFMGALARKRIHTVVYGAPQVWAWRPGRMQGFAQLFGRLAVTLPFEEALWKSAGVDATYVGHPVVEAAEALAPRAVIRSSLGMTPTARAIAVMPGSRPHEVRALLEPLLQAYERVRRDRASLDARVLFAPSLDPATEAWAKSACDAAHVPYAAAPPEGAMSLLPAFDLALCASGTASLEAAVAGCPPIVAYKVGLLTELAARALVKVEHVALPNVVLGRRAFAEHLQRDVEPKAIARSIHEAFASEDELQAACAAVRERLGPRRASRAVAELLG
jgi:lipid-A-disaccharide synthase